MAVDAVGDAADFSQAGLKSRQEARIAESLAAEEAAGRLLALRGRTVALIVIGVFLLLLAPFPEVLFYELMLALFIVAGYGRHAVESLGLFRWWQPYAQIALDFVLLAITLTVPNPLAAVQLPVQMSLRFGNFVYFYVLLVGLAFGYKPKLVIWGGVTGAARVGGGGGVDRAPAEHDPVASPRPRPPTPSCRGWRCRTSSTSTSRPATSSST